MRSITLWSGFAALAVAGLATAWAQEPAKLDPRANEPKGYTRVVEESFDSHALPRPWGRGSQSWNSGQSRIVADATAPQSPPNALQWDYAPTWLGGESPGKNGIEGFKPAYDNWYMSLWVKWSDPWTNHPSGVNKILYFSVTDGYAGIILNRRGGNVDVVMQTGQKYLLPIDSQRNLPKNRPAGTVADGEWHLIEVLMLGSTNGEAGHPANGVIRIWLDGKLNLEYTDVRFDATGDSKFSGILLDPIWGGVKAHPAQDQYIRFDHLYVSGKNRD